MEGWFYIYIFLDNINSYKNTGGGGGGGGGPTILKYIPGSKSEKILHFNIL